jgi:Fur family transcriptional regulator, stress-responsive regulator
MNRALVSSWSGIRWAGGRGGDTPARILDQFQKTGETSGVPTTSELQQLLRGAALRVTRPRVAVLTAVHAHPHADTDSIIGAVRMDLPEVSHQAVYDCLHALTAAGLVRRIQPSGSVARYESRVGDNHHHVMCRSCGVIADVDCAVGHTPCLTASDDHGFVIDEAEVIYWGLCADCSTASSSRLSPDTPRPGRIPNV